MRESNKPRHRLYFAAPLFSSAERKFNAELAAELEQYFEVFLPQRDGRLVVDLIAAGAPVDVALRDVFVRDVHAIRQADVLLAVLDGRAVDEGVAFELGVAHALGCCCIALQTDPRRLLPVGNNPMIAGACDSVFESEAELMTWCRTVADRPSLHVDSH